MYAKGERTSKEIIEAALRCLARDGYAATSVQRVADEAGVSKQVVIYYYGTREKLFARVVRHMGDQILAQTQEAVAELEDPADLVAEVVDRLWSGVTSDHATFVAWFGVISESMTNPSLRQTTIYISERLEGLVASLLDDVSDRGVVLHMPRPSIEILFVAAIQGLALKYLENGETPELRRARGDFQDALNTLWSVP